MRKQRSYSSHTWKALLKKLFAPFYETLFFLLFTLSTTPLNLVDFFFLFFKLPSSVTLFLLLVILSSPSYSFQTALPQLALALPFSCKLLPAPLLTIQLRHHHQLPCFNRHPMKLYSLAIIPLVQSCPSLNHHHGKVVVPTTRPCMELHRSYPPLQMKCSPIPPRW